MAKRWRQLTVWLHVLTSVSWMSQAMALCVLLSVGFADDSRSAAATSMAHTLDGRLLGPMADASAFTGIMLAAATPWGFFRHWWVLTKFGITIVQLYLGIFLLSPTLTASLTAGPSARQIAGTALMAGAIAFQGWLSVAKPWGRVRPRPPVRPGTAPRWVFAVAVLGGLADLALAFVIGHPLPLLSLILLGIALVRRRTWTAGVAAA
jgi:type IV secretory pathway VirB2 component (pilin)